MNGILGMNQLLLDSPLNEEQTIYAQAVNESGEHLLAIINDILEPFASQTVNLSFQSATKDLDLAAIFASNFLKEDDFKIDHLNFLVTS